MIDLYNDISAIKDDVNADGQFGTADTVERGKPCSMQ